MLENIYTIIYVLTVAVAIYFLVFLLRKAKKTDAAKALIWLIVVTAIWTSLEIFAASEVFDDLIRIYLWRATFFSASLTTFLLLRFTWVFFNLYNKIGNFVKGLIVLCFFVLFVFIIFTNNIVDGVLIDTKMWEVGYSKGQYYIFNVLLVAVFMFSGLLIAVFNYFKTKSKIKKKVFGIISIGIMFPSIMGVATNLVLPLLGVEFPRMANFSAVILMAVLFYVIYELNAFSHNVARYSIKFRLSVIMILVSIIGGIAGFFVFYSSFLNNIKSEFYDHLETASNSRARHIETYLKEELESFNLITGRKKLRAMLVEYANGEKENLPLMNDNINDAINPVNDFEIIHIVDLDGNIIVSTNNDYVGENISGKEVFTDGKKNDGINIIFEERDSSYKLVYSGPFVWEGEVIGVGVLITSINNLNNIVSDRTGLGKTGNLYVVNGNNYFLSQPLFSKEDVVMKKKIETENVKNCFSAKNNPEEQNDHSTWKNNLVDYRGVEVIGTHSYLPGQDWCVIAEVDKKEIEEKFDEEASRSFFISMLVIFLVSGGVAYLYARTISKPVLALKKGAEELSNWNLNYKVKIKSKDEFGSLAKAFNLMGDKLRESYSILERTVKERTEDLEQALDSMKDSRKAMLNILEDVDEEKDNVAEEKDKINAILHSIGDGVFVVDRGFRITMFNQIAADISGYSIREAFGKHYSEILRFTSEIDGKKNDDFIMKAMQTGEIQTMDAHTVLTRKNGEEKVAVADSAAPLKSNSGKIIGCVVVFRDVTKEREVDKAKTEFVSLASHQLRTPLSSINWYAEMLLAGDAGKINDDQEEYLKEIYKGNQRMVDLVNSLLNVSRMELGTFIIEPEKIDIIEMVKSVLGELESKIEKRKLKIKKSFNKKVKNMNVDPKLMRIIFQNLLSNAVKYTPEGGEVSVEINQDEKKKEFLLQISDTGMGIPKDQQDKIFSKLFRADNVRQTDTEGTGLGLYLIKSIMENAGGRVWFKSKENKGTTFFVSMPLSGMIAKEGTRELDIKSENL